MTYRRYLAEKVGQIDPHTPPLAAVKPATHAPCGACADGCNLRTLARVILETRK